MKLVDWLVVIKAAIAIIAFPVIFYLMICNWCIMHSTEKHRAYNKYLYEQLAKNDFCEANRALSAEFQATDDMNFDAPEMISHWDKDYLAEQPKCHELPRHR